MLNKFINTLNHLPRDSRDTLFLLLVIAAVVLPQVAYLPLWCSGLVAGVLLWRGTLAWQSGPLPGRWWLVALLVVAVAATWATHKTILGRDAGVTLLVILLALKTLELRAQRDAFVVFFLGFFCMLSNFLFSQSLLTAFAMLVALLGLLTALVNAHMPVGKPPLMAAAKIATKMALLGAPIMVVLFMLFPRLAPLWGLPGGPTQGKSGLSAEMRVGTIAKLALDDSIAMRIKFDGKPPAARDVYLRGPVLSAFDGREWLPSKYMEKSATQTANLSVTGQPIGYEVTLEPSNKPWLFALDAAAAPPLLADHELRMTPELQWLSNRPITELVRYKAQSYLQFSYGPEKPDLSLQNLLALPAGYNPRTRRLAADIKRDAGLNQVDTASLVNTVMQRLRTGGYEYTLEPGVYGDNTADEFWFDRKTGFCEHIASSFVVLMRALDVPARVVTGYQGGEFNAVDGYWVVRQSDAHAWVEVWQAGSAQGDNVGGKPGSWVRVDPTSAVAPQRIDSLQRLAAPNSVFGGAMASLWTSTLGGSGYNPLLQLRDVWDAVNNTWNQRVLNYTEAKQLSLLKNLGFSSPSWADLSYVLIAVVVAASLLGIAWTLWDRRQHDPWLRLLTSVRIKLEKSGLKSKASTSPRELAYLVKSHFGESALPLTAWLIKLEELRYGSQGENTQSATKITHLRTDVHTDLCTNIFALKSELKNLLWPVK
jgi:protein-glutamine gamma-glutamyltransferase